MVVFFKARYSAAGSAKALPGDYLSFTKQLSNQRLESPANGRVFWDLHFGSGLFPF